MKLRRCFSIVLTLALILTGIYVPVEAKSKTDSISIAPFNVKGGIKPAELSMGVGEDLKVRATITFDFETPEPMSASMPIGVHIYSRQPSAYTINKSEESEYDDEIFYTVTPENSGTTTHQDQVEAEFTFHANHECDTDVWFRFDLNNEDSPQSTCEFSVPLTITKGSSTPDEHEQSVFWTRFYSNGGIFSDGREFYELPVRVGQPMMIPTIASIGLEPPTGKVFDHWEIVEEEHSDGSPSSGVTQPASGNHGQVNVGGLFTPADDTTFQATWRDPSSNNQYEVTYKANNGTKEKEVVTYQEGALLSVAGPSVFEFTVPTGKKFLCWKIAGASDMDADSFLYVTGEDSSVRVLDDMTLEAVYVASDVDTSVTGSCSIKYLDADGNDNLLSTCYPGSTHTFLTIEDAGIQNALDRVFEGWHIQGEPNEKLYKQKQKITVNSSIVVEPVFKTYTHEEQVAITASPKVCLHRQSGSDGIADTAIDNYGWIGVNKDAVATYSIDASPADNYSFVLESVNQDSNNPVIDAKLSGGTLEVKGLAAGSADIQFRCIPSSIAFNPFQGTFHVAVSEIKVPDTTKAEAAATASTTLASQDASTLTVNDKEITCKSGTVSADDGTADNKTDATISEDVLSTVVGNLLDMEDGLTEDEKTALENGDDIFVYVGVTDYASADNVAAETKTAIEGEVTSGETVGMYTELDLFAQVGDCPRRPISDTGDDEGVEVTVNTENKLPTIQLGKTRSFGAVRFHDGVADKLSGVTSNGNTAKFKSPKFSTYAITYTDTTSVPIGTGGGSGYGGGSGSGSSGRSGGSSGSTGTTPTPTPTKPDTTTPTEDTSSDTSVTSGTNSSEKKVGDTVTTSTKVSYTISGKKTATYSSSGDKSSASVPEAIKVNGKKYKVTKIAAKAFYKNKKVKKLTIGKNVTSMGVQALYDCSNLKTIVVEGKLTKIGKNATKGIHPKATIKIKATKTQYKKIKKAFLNSGCAKTVKFKRI